MRLFLISGLASNNNFAGSLKYVYYNDISVLYELKNKNPKVHYIGNVIRKKNKNFVGLVVIMG